jgi:hypothetical protein
MLVGLFLRAARCFVSAVAGRSRLAAQSLPEQTRKQATK